jgi:hypothetical protein
MNEAENGQQKRKKVLQQLPVGTTLACLCWDEVLPRPNKGHLIRGLRVKPIAVRLASKNLIFTLFYLTKQPQ